MEITKLYDGIYKNKKVLITGHTGFKGSWLALWLNMMGAEVLGYALEAPTSPSHFSLLNLDINSVIGDIRNQSLLNSTFKDFQPEIVFHMAAQPLVRDSYIDPVLTYETNVIGSLKVFEACRQTPSVTSIVNITTDKCYENKEWLWGYREDEPMGGYDPYSSSKGCSEIMTASYRNSFFNLNDYGKKHNCLLATARAGNVIGGGDWAKDRLIPDIIKSISKNETVEIRSPKATRPWQHVLEPLSGYLLLGKKLLEQKKDFAESWNFGPNDEAAICVEEVVKNIKDNWNSFDYKINVNPNELHEAMYLKLDSSKAKNKLGWNPTWNSKKTFEMTTKWYLEYIENNNICSKQNIVEFIQK